MELLDLFIPILLEKISQFLDYKAKRNSFGGRTPPIHKRMDERDIEKRGEE